MQQQIESLFKHFRPSLSMRLAFSAHFSSLYDVIMLSSMINIVLCCQTATFLQISILKNRFVTSYLKIKRD